MLRDADIDAVDSMVPISLNYDIANQVISHKKNLIAEKPFASEPEAARKLEQLAKSNNVKVMVAENFRYEEENLIIKDIVSNGKIGQVIYFIDNNAGDFSEDMKMDTFAAKNGASTPHLKAEYS
jgi:predicted dehydrogenase